MKRRLMVGAVIAAMACLVVGSAWACATCGCSGEAKPKTGCGPKTGCMHKKGPSLCGKCGEVKAGEKCCLPDAAKCDKCGLAEGAPGCCKLAGDGKDAALCVKCGQIKGGEACCKPDAKTCDKCGLAKGAPGCCKIAPAK